MPSAIVLTCESVECPSGGTWQVIEYATPAGAFNPADLDPAVLAAAFAAGFISLGTALVIVWCGKALLQAIKGG